MYVGTRMANHASVSTRGRPNIYQSMVELYEQFKCLIRYFRIFAELVVKRRGLIMFEWPAYALLWREPVVVSMCDGLKLQRVLFHGCALGLKDKEGTPVMKPWRLATSNSAVIRIIRKKTWQIPPARTTHDRRRAAEHGILHPRIRKNSVYL